MMRNDLPAPPRHSGAALPLISLDYLIALSPILIANLLRNGPRTLVMVLLSALVAAATEALCEALLRRRTEALAAQRKKEREMLRQWEK